MSIKITLNFDQVQAIRLAPVSGAYGSAERIALKEELEIGVQHAIKTAPDSTLLEVEASKEELKAWAAGCIEGWNQSQVVTQGGAIPMTDGHRNLLRLSAKALRVWETVKKALPKVEVDESFAIDPDLDDEIELDAEVVG